MLLWYQFHLTSSRLFGSKIISYGVSLILAIPGLVVMLICIRKYFYGLSGIRTLNTGMPEITPTLQQTGIHRYVRHPLYLGTLLFVWGLFLMFPFLNNLIAAAVITIYVLIGIRLEEEKLLLEYGIEYQLYKAKVPRLIPKLKM